MGVKFIQKLIDRDKTLREIKKNRAIKEHENSLFGQAEAKISRVFGGELKKGVCPDLVKKGDHLTILSEEGVMVILKQSKEIGELDSESCVGMLEALSDELQGCFCLLYTSPSPRD